MSGHFDGLGVCQPVLSHGLREQVGMLAQAVAGTLDVHDHGMVQKAVHYSAVATTGWPKTSAHSEKPWLLVRIMAPRSYRGLTS